jgi:hypothetical protein
MIDELIEKSEYWLCWGWLVNIYSNHKKQAATSYGKNGE